MPRHQVMVPIQPPRQAEPIPLPNDDLEAAMVPGVRYKMVMCACQEGHVEQGTASESGQGPGGDGEL